MSTYVQKLQRILELFRIHQQRIGFVGTVYRSPISLEQIYTLIEISITPDASVGEISAILRLPRNSVSRALAWLEHTGYIKGEVNHLDTRRRIFRLLKKGTDFMTLHESNTRRFVEEHLSYLSPSEIIELQQFQHRICNALNTPKVTLRKTEHPFQEGMRRVTRAFGFIGNSLYGSKHSSTEWHILSAIDCAPAPLTLSELSELLGLLPTTLTQILSRMERTRVLKRRKHAHDGRRKLLRLTDKGRNLLEKINSTGRALLANSFSSSQTSELDRFYYVLAKHLNVLKPEPLRVIRPSREVIRLHSEEELSPARSFVVFNLVTLGWYEHLGPELLSPQNLILALCEGIELLAVVEIATRDTQPLVNVCAYRRESLSTAELTEFIIQVLLKSIAISGTDALLMRHTTIPPECLTRIKVTTVDTIWSKLSL